MIHHLALLWSVGHCHGCMTITILRVEAVLGILIHSGWSGQSMDNLDVERKLIFAEKL